MRCTKKRYCLSAASLSFFCALLANFQPPSDSCDEAVIRIKYLLTAQSFESCPSPSLPSPFPPLSQLHLIHNLTLTNSAQNPPTNLPPPKRRIPPFRNKPLNIYHILRLRINNHHIRILSHRQRPFIYL